MTAWVETYPATLVPVDAAGAPIDGDPVQAFQLRPGDVERLTAWAEVTGYPGADGGVLLLHNGRVVGTVALGEFVVRDATGALRVETSAAELFRQYQPAP